MCAAKHLFDHQFCVYLVILYLGWIFDQKYFVTQEEGQYKASPDTKGTKKIRSVVL